MLRRFSYVLHVRRTRADVFGGDVSTAKCIDKTSMRAKDLFASERLIVSDDDRLTAAKRNSRERVLVSHATRKTQHVVNRFLFVSIMPETRAADCWSKTRAVYRY